MLNVQSRVHRPPLRCGPVAARSIVPSRRGHVGRCPEGDKPSSLPGDNPLSASCLVAVSGMHLGTLADHRPQTLKDGDELLLLAPVAGG